MLLVRARALLNCERAQERERVRVGGLLYSLKKNKAGVIFGSKWGR